MRFAKIMTENDPNTPVRRSPKLPTAWFLLAVGGFVTFMVTVLGIWYTRTPGVNLPAGVSANDFRLAQEAFQLKYGRRPDRIDGLSYLAEWYLTRGREADAVECFAEIPTEHQVYGRMARYQQAVTLLKLHRAAKAEQQFRELIACEEASPTINRNDLIDARQRLRHILEVELRFEERKALLKGVVERGEADRFETAVYCFSSLLRWNGPDAIKWADEFYSADPSQVLLRIARGRYLTGQGQLVEARNLLETVLAEAPEDRWAAAALIACLRESDDLESAQRLASHLPAQAADDPWLLLLQRGALALKNHDVATAENAYNQLLEADPTNVEAWQRKGQIARTMGNEKLRAHAMRVVGILGRIQNLLGKAIQSSTDLNSYVDIADLCTEVGLNREAAIMAQFAKRSDPDNQRASAMVERIRSGIVVETGSMKGND